MNSLPPAALLLALLLPAPAALLLLALVALLAPVALVALLALLALSADRTEERVQQDRSREELPSPAPPALSVLSTSIPLKCSALSTVTNKCYCPT